jgi:hypothetical protein
MDIKDKYKKLLASLPKEAKALKFDISIRQYGIDRMVVENDFTTIETGIKEFLNNLYDRGVLNTKPTAVIAGYGDTPRGKEFSVFTCFSKKEE